MAYWLTASALALMPVRVASYNLEENLLLISLQTMLIAKM